MDDNNVIFFSSFFIFIILMSYWTYHHYTQALLVRRRRKQRKGGTFMSEALQAFVGKECVITISAVSGGTVIGTVKSVNDSWLTLEGSKSGETNMVNTDYIMRIREHPTNKRGKKRSIITD